MIKSIKPLSKLILLVLFVMLCTFGCKSRKKVVEISKPSDAAKTEQEAANLRKQKEEEQRKADAEEQARKNEEANQKALKESAPYTRLGNYFNAITGASNVEAANNSIYEALGLFATPDAPVLIVISGSGDQKDFDRPTTIKSYLNYLKDQKKNLNRIEHLDFDSAGKITGVELRKN